MQIAPYLQLDRFFERSDHSRLLNYVFDQAANFVPTTTSSGVMDYRKSTILYQFDEFHDWMIDRVQTVLPIVFDALNITPFPVSQIEVQLTAHNDGHYYKIHNDSGSKDAATRIISYVYYFYQEPKGFSGGELRLYNWNLEQGDDTDSFVTIEPTNNSIVFFPSHHLHEVLPVVCASRQFADSRFTLNGWIRSL